DEHARAGGQLFKQIHKFFGSQAHMAGARGYDIGECLLGECRELGVRVLLSTVAYGIFPERLIGIATQTHVDELQAERIIIATGASENPLAFPGWTLPGVMGAGAAQTLMNVHRVLPGRRVLIVGAGNVGLIVGFQLRQAGAEVVAVVEATDRVTGYMIHAAKLTRTEVPILLRHTIAEASGNGKVERAIVKPVGDTEGERRTFDVDCVCIAVGLSPLAELAHMAECRMAYLPELGGHVPLHDENMATSAPGVYIAGDVAGVEEVNTAMDEGRLAGVAVAESLDKIDGPEAERRKGLLRERLDGLRLGPFGEHRQRAKQRLQTMLRQMS
ncbi:MAG: NAD(P)/FAD-dependent oxidoreductase, partial [Armatimonadota bacterium]